MARLLTPLLLGALLLAAPAFAQEGELKSGDAKKLSKPLGDWVEALVDGDAQKAAEAQGKLYEAAIAVNKRLKDRDVLSLVRDWEILFDTGRDFATSGAWVKKGKFTEHELNGNLFSIWVPSRYNPKKNSYPALLLLSDGDRAAMVEALPAEILDAFVIVAPDLAGLDSETLAEKNSQIRMLVASVQGSIHLRIDRSRLFLVADGDVGRAAGSELAVAFPSFFAGFSVIGGEATPSRGASNLDLLAHSAEVADLATAAAWCAEAEPRWFYPDAFKFELTCEWAGRAYWVQATKFDVPTEEGAEPSRFEVSVDRESNTITLESTGVYSFALYLNDEIVDLDREVTVVRNGEAYTGNFSRTLGIVLGQFQGSFDGGAIFTARLSQLDVPQKATGDEGQ